VAAERGRERAQLQTARLNFMSSLQRLDEDGAGTLVEVVALAAEAMLQRMEHTCRMDLSQGAAAPPKRRR
jgi:hypothetical protein